MTAKRFTNTDNGFIVDYESKQKVLNLYDVVELLNELSDENEQLKKELKSFKPIIFESDGKSVTLYEKRGDVE